MERISRKIKLFWTIYGNLLLKIFIGILGILLALRGINTLYVIDKEEEIEKSNAKIISKEEQKEIEENIQFIRKFLDYCNSENFEKAYNMLSQKCIEDRFQTIDIFKQDFINKIFNYEKDYDVTKENNCYKIKIYEGILQSGKIEGRNYVEIYVTIEEEILEEKIRIER